VTKTAATLFLMLVCVLCVPAITSSGWLSTNRTTQTTLAEGTLDGYAYDYGRVDYVYMDIPQPQQEEIIYGEVPLSVDIWSDFPDVFYGTEMEFVGGDWVPPEYYRLYWNESTQTLDAPPIENQVTDAYDMFVEADPNASLWVCMRPNIWSSDYHIYYLGTEPEYDGFATNGIVLNTTNHAYKENITATISPHDWNYTGWCHIYIQATTFYQIDDDTYFDGSGFEDRMFYLNTSPAQPIPDIVVPDDTNSTTYNITDGGINIISPTTDNDQIGMIVTDGIKIVSIFSLFIIAYVVVTREGESPKDIFST